VASELAGSEDFLLKRAFEALDTRELPHALDPRCWGGHGIGLGCDLCGLPISSLDIEIQATADPYGAAIRLHSLCYTQWQRACCQSLGERAASDSRNAPNPLASSDDDEGVVVDHIQ
jgi:hypothetical protein